MKNFIICVKCIIIIGIYSFSTYCKADQLMQCGMEETMEQMARTFFGAQPWPNGRIPYVIDSSLRPSDRTTVQSVIEDFHKHTCVRFRKKTNQDKDFMTVRVSFNTSKCGTAVFCYVKNLGSHFAQVSNSCSNRWVWTHEISHILCLGHEQSRSDRNDFLSFEGCTNANQIAPVPNNQQLRGQIYDYYSVTSYGCYGKCWGTPKLDPKYVKKCGQDASGPDTGLNVLDIEKINEYYDCYYGCNRHRWYNINNLTLSHMRSVVNFASSNGDDEPVYLCRGYNRGDIAVGWFRIKENMCQINNFGSTFNVTEHIQLFALPRGLNRITRDSQPYRLYSNADNSAISKYLAVGRDVDNKHIFAATGQITLANGKLRTVVGRVDSYSLWIAYPPGLESLGISSIEQFDIIGCTEK